MPEPRQLDRPPIAEAVCEFRFSPSSPWDSAIPGQVYQALSGTLFPKKRTEQVVEAKLSATGKGLTQHVGTAEALVILSQDERQFARIAERRLSVHRVAPYESWSQFLPVIEQTLDEVLAVAAPCELQRVGLRYINRIEFPSESIDVDEHFQFCLKVGKELHQSYGQFMAGAVFHNYQDGRDALRIQLSSSGSAPNTTLSLILDLDYFLTQPALLSVDGVSGWLSDAHGAIEEAFFAAITEKTLALFEG